MGIARGGTSGVWKEGGGREEGRGRKKRRRRPHTHPETKEPRLQMRSPAAIPFDISMILNIGVPYRDLEVVLGQQCVWLAAPSE